jgi:hypothetical protein
MKRKRVNLVSQYMERISGDALEEYQSIFREFARRRNGVYALYRKGRLHYVGLARDLRGRLNAHLKDRHRDKWDRFSIYLTIGEEHIRELESLVMRIAQPAGNRQLGKFPRAENLKRQFAQKIREDARLRLDALLGRERPSRHGGSTRPKLKSGRVPVLSKWTLKGFRIRAQFKGKILRARVSKKGVIRYRGKSYRSPSNAARAAIGKKRAINGWRFWFYERAPGDWVALNELRR